MHGIVYTYIKLGKHNISCLLDWEWMTQDRVWGEGQAKSWESKPTIDRIEWSHLSNKSSGEIKLPKIQTIF